MKIAIINEVSASPRNGDIIRALEQTTDARLLNVGMKNPDQLPQLSYIHTSYMGAMLLNSGACDFVVGGCGTGQGFINAILQFPGVFCGLIYEPLDAWLFSQINGGNCVSLALNKSRATTSKASPDCTAMIFPVSIKSRYECAPVSGNGSFSCAQDASSAQHSAIETR